MEFLWGSKRKIAVAGIIHSGKTAFLTSLLWQLHEFEDADFHLDQNVKITKFAKVRDGSTFPFNKFQDAMAKRSEWPSKTTDSHKYVAECRRSDRRQPQTLEFLDFPGERVADAAIAAYDDFADWSDHMFDHFDSHSGYREAEQVFLQELEYVLAEPESPSREPFRWDPTGLFSKRKDRHAGVRDQVVRSYRKALARYALDCKPLVSPSVFLLDRQGDVARPAQPDALAETRLCGLDASSQFAPLPKHLRDTHPELTQGMQTHYKRYRTELVMPLFDDLTSSQGMIVLVDIPSLLLGGVDRYNDNRQIVLDLFEVMQRDSFIGSLLGSFGFSPALERIAFVATKADLVRKSDLKDGRLKSLLRSMNNRAKNLFPDAEIGWFDCSACISTTQMDDDKLHGVLTQDNPQRVEMEFPVSPLPMEWPSDWDPETYQFPSVFPRPPRNYQTPPRHRNLDAVFDFVAMH